MGKIGRVVRAGASYEGKQGPTYTPGVSAESVEVAGAGDFLYIPAGVPHVAVNRSPTTPAVFVGARTDPNEQESVIMRADLDARVP